MVSQMANSYHKALSIILQAHKDQTDLAGKPYYLHPLYVSKQVKGKKAKIVALLHDTIEDTNIDANYLSKYFTKDVCEAVELLTREENQSYSDYINKIKNNELAKTVKLADLKHNMDITRLSTLTQNDLERLKKYHCAYKELTDEK